MLRLHELPLASYVAAKEPPAGELTIETIHAARERIAAVHLHGIAVNPTDVVAMWGGDGIAPAAWGALAGVPVLISTRVAPGTYRAAETAEEWRALYAELGGG